jgi:thioredoxin 1
MDLNENNFEEEVLKSAVPTLVDFWAPWCTPCKMMGPVLEEASQEWEGKIKVCKLNVDEVMSVARNYEIQSIPTMILFENGQPVKRIVGARPKGALMGEFESWIK